jgi:hypothetical protein
MKKSGGYIHVTNFGFRFSKARPYIIAIFNLIFFGFMLISVVACNSNQPNLQKEFPIQETTIVFLLFIFIFLLSSYAFTLQYPLYPEESQMVLIFWILYRLLLYGRMACTEDDCIKETFRSLNIIYSIAWIVITGIFMIFDTKTLMSSKTEIIYGKNMLCSIFIILFFLPVQCNTPHYQRDWIVVSKYYCFFIAWISQRFLDIANTEILCRASIINKNSNRKPKNKTYIRITSKPTIIYTTVKVLWTLSVCEYFLPLVLLQISYFLVIWYTKSCKIIKRQQSVLFRIATKKNKIVQNI